MEQRKSKKGPEPERVKIDKPWTQAIAGVLKKKRPKDGWAEPQKGSKAEKKPA